MDDVLEDPFRLCVVGPIDFLIDSHAAKYVVELESRPEAFERLFGLLNDPANEQRLVDAECHGMPALTGVVRFIEGDPAIAGVLETGSAALRFRQAVGVAVKLKMARLGWVATGRKGAVRGAHYFAKAEHFAEAEFGEDENGENEGLSAYAIRAIAGLDAIAKIGDPEEQAETCDYLMKALAETRRAEGRVF